MLAVRHMHIVKCPTILAAKSRAKTSPHPSLPVLGSALLQEPDSFLKSCRDDEFSKEGAEGWYCYTLRADEKGEEGGRRTESVVAIAAAVSNGGC
ncbi:hypothetical protein PIB30_025540 [Stylosanthes scabra]|uniref:Uncharacterized protein n=1 Tax=Stylosanthes scabra TaxID=79078 RepID=A0ABU6Z9N8_9FABA|nr:hypothetical protein [Stylosanthes scabra]